MCTMIAQQVNVNGSARGGSDWQRIDLLSVTYDHPFHIPLEYTLNLDFTNQAGMRVAVELDDESARALIAALQDVMSQAEAGGFIGT